MNPVASTSRAVASTSRAILQPCVVCQRRYAAAGKSVGKTAQSKSSAPTEYDSSKLSPVAQSHIPAELHPSYPFVRHVVYTGANRDPISYSHKGHIDLQGKSLYRWMRDRARTELGHAPSLKPEWLVWFGKANHPTKLHTGSIIQVESYNNSTRTSTTRFSGMLLGVRRAGGATTFTLRNVIHKTGVEMTFILGSPVIRDISVILRASPSKYRTDPLGNAIYPRWPRLKARDMEKRSEAWSERTNLALRILRTQEQNSARNKTRVAEAAAL